MINRKIFCKLGPRVTKITSFLTEGFLDNGIYTHTHLFNGPFSRTTRVNRYQKGKTNLDFTEARDSEWHPTPPVFYRLDALPAAQPTASKHWRDNSIIRGNFLSVKYIDLAAEASTESPWYNEALWREGCMSEWVETWTSRCCSCSVNLLFNMNSIASAIPHWSMPTIDGLNSSSAALQTHAVTHHRPLLLLTTVLQQQPFNGRLSGTTRVGRYQKKHSPAHTHPDQCTSFITFLH